MPAPHLGSVHRPGSGNDFLDVMRTLGGRYYDENGTLVFNEEGVKRFFQFSMTPLTRWKSLRTI